MVVFRKQLFSDRITAIGQFLLFLFVVINFLFLNNFWFVNRIRKDHYIENTYNVCWLISFFKFKLKTFFWWHFHSEILNLHILPKPTLTIDICNVGHFARLQLAIKEKSWSLPLWIVFNFSLKKFWPFRDHLKMTIMLNFSIKKCNQSLYVFL
jgi:hypothetical protein